MKRTTYCDAPIWGVQSSLPLKGFPEGRARIVMRNEDWARVYIKTENGIREFYIKEEDGYWIPAFEQNNNERR